MVAFTSFVHQDIDGFCQDAMFMTRTVQQGINVRDILNTVNRLCLTLDCHCVEAKADEQHIISLHLLPDADDTSVTSTSKNGIFQVLPQFPDAEPYLGQDTIVIDKLDQETQTLFSAVHLGMQVVIGSNHSDF